MDLTQLQSQLSTNFITLAIYFALCAMKGQQYDHHHQFSPKLKLTKQRVLCNVIRPLLQHKNNTAPTQKKKKYAFISQYSISTSIHPTECENYMTGSARHAMIKFG